MKKKELKSADIRKVSEVALLSLAAAKLKGRVLFPKRVAAAKKYLQNATIAKP